MQGSFSLVSASHGCLWCMGESQMEWAIYLYWFKWGKVWVLFKEGEIQLFRKQLFQISRHWIIVPKSQHIEEDTTTSLVLSGNFLLAHMLTEWEKLSHYVLWSFWCITHLPACQFNGTQLKQEKEIPFCVCENSNYIDYFCFSGCDFK